MVDNHPAPRAVRSSFNVVPGVLGDVVGATVSNINQRRFPVTDRHAGEIISFPVDQFLSRGEQDIVIETVRDFYEGR